MFKTRLHVGLEMLQIVENYVEILSDENPQTEKEIIEMAKDMTIVLSELVIKLKDLKEWNNV